MATAGPTLVTGLEETKKRVGSEFDLDLHRDFVSLCVCLPALLDVG